MSIEYTPVDLACNLKCEYCYQEPMREAGNIADPKDWERVKAQLIRQGYKFSVFGGEPLLAPIEHLEEVFKFGYERFGSNGIQTNGTLITQRHIDLFKKYRVGVGISCDGPKDLSDLRRDDDIRRTRISTSATISAIEALSNAGIYPSIIVTVHKMNGSFLQREDLKGWFEELDVLGIQNINLHMLEVEKGLSHLALEEHENAAAFLDLYQFSKSSRIQFQPFRDISRLLLDEELDRVSCIWNACDPLTTAAVQGVSRNGTLHNCGRTNKDGVNWVKADIPGKERYLVLHSTPQEVGGCQDCNYFAFCKGNCPGTAIDGDWRNRTIHCSTWKHLFTAIERDIIADRRLPVSRDRKRLAQIIDQLLGSDSRGIAVTWLNV